MATGEILCLGGSLTVGDDALTSSFRTYRGALQNLFATAGLSVNFVGPNYLPPAAGGSDGEHAGYVDHSIDSTGHATNNLTAKLTQLKIDFPSPDLIIIDPPWWDIVNAPGSLASRYNTFIGAVQGGAWASVPVLMCTAHPASGQTAAQTAGVYAAYPLVNAQIETTRAAAPSTRFVADLAARTLAATSAALTERAIYFASKAPDFLQIEGGKNCASWQGGHLVTSFKSIQDFNAQWSTNPPAVGNAPGGMGLSDPNVSSWNGTVNRFVQSVAGVTPWYWIYCLPGHAASNTCVEVRNMFAAAKRIGGGWEFFFSGARVGIQNNNCSLWDGPNVARDGNGNEYLPDSRSVSGFRADGLTSYHAPRGNTGYEVWPVDTIPSRGIVSFNGGSNRDLMANAESFWWGVQCRLALINPSGPDDRPQARFGAKCGGDFVSTLGGRHYDRYGWPYNVMDGGGDSWTRVDWTDWQMLSALAIGREGSPDTGVSSTYHWSDPGTPPPLANWSPPTPYNNPADGRSLTISQIRANPVPVPPYWEGGSSGGTTSGYLVNDYFLPASGSRLYLFTQSGADKMADTIATAAIASGTLSGFTGGGIVFEPLPGLARKPNVSLLVNGSGKINVEPKDWSTAVAPVWQTTSIPAASIGAAYSAQLSAGGDPAATYSIVSGAPGWLSCSSSGSLTGTASGSAATYIVTFRATNSEGTADLVLSLTVVDTVVITTTSLPNAIQGVPYSQTLLASGVEPFSWSITGTLPPGLALAGQAIAGTPTLSTGTYGFTANVTDALGRTDTQALSITLGAAGNVPVITTSSLPAGTVGDAYSQTLSVSGTGPITVSVVSGAIPPGTTLNASTRELSGTPTGAGAYGFTVRAANAFGFGDASFSVVINPSAAVESVASPWGRFVRQ